MKLFRTINVKLWSIIFGITTLLFIVSIVGDIITDNYESVINIAFNTSSTKIVTDENDTTDTAYFKSAYKTAEEAKAASRAIAEEITAEGAVLLKNANQALPLSKTANVTIFGHSSANTIVCGTGSADIDDTDAVDFKTAIESKTDLKINEDMWNFYSSSEILKKYETNPKKGDNSIRNGADGVTKGEYTVNEVPWNLLPNSKNDSKYKDAAIVVFSRLGGEMYDLPADVAHQGNTKETVNSSGNSLELTIQERELLKEIEAAGYKKTIVLINSANALECDFVDEAALGVDACMWIGYTGLFGLNAVSDLLVGNKVPSGKLVDTYCVDNTTSPAHVNIYGGTWSNVADYGVQMFDLSLDSNMYYNVYQEGIYVGYRYYETRYADYVLGHGNPGNYNYDADVKYPFGYGLSYTTFEYSNYSVKENSDSFDVTVKVTNTGEYSGKEVVEVYFQSPYTDYDKAHKIEKSAIELCGFAKTGLLKKGESETVTINVPKKELRTYDAYNEKTYILDAGDYYITVGNGAHAAVNNVLMAQNADTSKMSGVGNKDLVYKWNNPTLDKTTYSVSEESGEVVEITNQLEEADLNLAASGNSEKITYLSRSNWLDTFPKAPLQLALSAEMAQAMTSIKKYTKLSSNRQMPTMGKDGTMTLAQMIGKDFNDPLWQDLLDQVTYEEMCLLIGVGYHSTYSVASVAKPRTVDENGPQGFTAKLTDIFGKSATVCAYTDENIMAATWNVEFMEKVGEAIGEDGLQLGMSGLYGPAMNTHRSPYSGRNFEYYSEDGFLGGKIAAAEVKGIQSKGVYVYLKHFAFNDSETHCRCYSIFGNEQSLREVYLEPFEHAVVEGDAMNVMNSFGRVGVVWTGAHEGLMTTILRGEWGMRGFALTDYSNTGKTFDVKFGVLAGTDSWDCSAQGPGSWSDVLLKWEAQQDVELTWAMRNATHRILYTVANSNAMNGMSPSSKIVAVTPWWKACIYGLMGVTGVAMVASGALDVLAIINRKKAKKEEEPAA